MPHADLKIRRGIEPHRILPRQENARDCPHALDGAATNVQPLVEYWGVLYSAIATVLLLIKIMKIIDKQGKLPWLSYIGKASLTIMFTHIVINQALLYYIGYHLLNFILTIAIGCLLHFFFNKFYLTRFFLLGTK